MKTPALTSLKNLVYLPVILTVSCIGGEEPPVNLDKKTRTNEVSRDRGEVLHEPVESKSEPASEKINVGNALFHDRRITRLSGLKARDTEDPVVVFIVSGDLEKILEEVDLKLKDKDKNMDQVSTALTQVLDNPDFEEAKEAFRGANTIGQQKIVTFLANLLKQPGNGLEDIFAGIDYDAASDPKDTLTFSTEEEPAVSVGGGDVIRELQDQVLDDFQKRGLLNGSSKDLPQPQQDD